MKFVQVEQLEGEKLEEQEGQVLLKGPIQSLRKVANEYQKYFENITLWMVNSTATGGGVAELLPRNINILTQLGIKCEWGVLQVDNPAFFDLTKRLHKTLQGFADKKSDTEYSDQDREVFEHIIENNSPALLDRVKENDVVVIHDPQPISLILPLRKKFGKKIICVWRFHIQFDENDESSKGAWEFLRKYVDHFDLCVFSTKEYLPSELSARGVVIPPGISSLGEKNLDLSLRESVEIMVRAGICPPENSENPVEPYFEHQAKRFCADGEWRTPAETKFSILTQPVITQISRWDPLKGWPQLLRAFQKLKEEAGSPGEEEKGKKKEKANGREKIRACKLVLVGPDPAFVKDDPEGKLILDELKKMYQGLSPELQKDVAILNLPMNSVGENALMVNVIQRASSFVIQNSLKEGFGLTAAEALWKRLPVVVSGYCPGLRAQVRDGIDGRWILGPEICPYEESRYEKELVKVMRELIEDDALRKRMGINAQKRITEVFLTYNPLCKWIQAIGDVIKKRDA